MPPNEKETDPDPSAGCRLGAPTYMLMAAVEGSGGGGAAAVKRRRDASTRRRSGGGGGGVSVRKRRVQHRQVDAPTAPPLQRLLAACRRAFRGPGTVPAPDDVALIRGILDKMGADDVHLRAVAKAATASGLQTLRTRPVITRTTIYECANFSIVIFLLPPGAVIPLHNHPGMTVFSKPLHGSLHVTSYDWVLPQQHRQGDDDATWSSSSTTTGGDGDPPRKRRLAKVVLDADLRAPCDALVLFPESGGNMHRFAAATPCAVLDVLGPPYSAGDRDCTYYQDLPCSSRQDDHAGNEDGGGGSGGRDEQQRRVVWLQETDKPKTLEMYEVPYRGPPIV
ncbi:hypothetical protein U9M48_010057 [Paspalum notatum var. saurae]|uniref:cysteine dioxygenase n=1 Tax=Paspalum notatum var. saurae TaxID=547442 RepID=A0AAQ3SU68_PASNO